MEVIFTDSGLIGKGEHSYTLIKKVGEALTRRGVRHRAFGARSIDPAIVEELGVAPHFSHSLYFGVVAPTSKRRLPSALFDSLRRVDADPNLPSERETFKLLSASFEEDLAALPEDVWRADNLLVVPAISYNELAALIKTLLALPLGRRPHVICQLMFPPNWTSWGGSGKLGPGLYRKAFALARPLIGQTLFFTAENDAIARLYHKKFQIDVDILPAPFGDTRPAAPVAGTPTFGFFGYSKSEKGFHLLPRAIEICRERGLEANFTIQLQHNGWEPATVAAEAHLRRIPDVRLIDGVLSERDYIAETARIDAMLLPYDPYLFGPRGSGIFTQSVAAGRPIVASVGTFAATCVARGEAEGEVFSPYDAEALAAAITRLSSRLPASQVRAAALAKSFARRHSADAYVDVLLSRLAR
jgi:glycosyltransferase involved in cell wall biosynthesis